MKAVVLARRYAKALFELAQEKKLLDQVAGEIGAVSKAIEDDSQLRNFFFSPEKAQRKSDVVKKSLNKTYSELTVRFLLFLVEKGRQNILSEIAVQFAVLYDKSLNKMRATAISAKPLTKTEISDIEKQLSLKFSATFEVKNEVNASILGGLVLKVGGKIFDNSIQNHLNQLEKTMLAES